MDSISNQACALPHSVGAHHCSVIFQLLFDFLAFKNDISFWKKKKSMIGMSTKAGSSSGLARVLRGAPRWATRAGDELALTSTWVFVQDPAALAWDGF